MMEVYTSQTSHHYYHYFSTGRQLPVNHYDTLLKQVNIENDDDDLEKIIKKIVTPLIPYMGELAGLILIALCCCWKNVAVANALVFLGVVNLVAGILAYFAPSMDTLPLVAGFGALFGLSRGNTIAVILLGGFCNSRVQMYWCPLLRR